MSGFPAIRLVFSVPPERAESVKRAVQLSNSEDRRQEKRGRRLMFRAAKLWGTIL